MPGVVSCTAVCSSTLSDQKGTTRLCYSSGLVFCCLDSRCLTVCFKVCDPHCASTAVHRASSFTHVLPVPQPLGVRGSILQREPEMEGQPCTAAGNQPKKLHSKIQAEVPLGIFPPLLKMSHSDSTKWKLLPGGLSCGTKNVSPTFFFYFAL